MSASPVRVTHVITGLNSGGAEWMLYRLLSRSDKRFFEHQVISLIDEGPVGARIRGLGIPVFPMGMCHMASVPKSLYDVAARIRRTGPDIVHTWLYHSDLIGGLAAKLFSSAKIIWHIHHKDLVPPLIKLRTQCVARACAKLSRSIPDRIVFCSKAAMTTHAAFGYDAGRMITIPNGFDLDEFCPNRDRGLALREKLGIPKSSVALALIGRFAPVKDHETFLAAAAHIQQAHPGTTFVLFGEGVTPDNTVLMDWVRRAGVADNCRLLGRKDNMPDMLSAIDIVVSSSRTEAFPCAVGEAMAMEIPCVVTDVGDAAFMVGDTGRVVPPRNPKALADACAEIIRMREHDRRLLGRHARRRIRLEFSLPSVTERVETLYRTLCSI